MSDLSATTDIAEFQLRVLTFKDLVQIVKYVKSKPCDQDPLPSALMVQHKEAILPLSEKNVNASLSQCIFPQEWKIATVQPLTKDLIPYYQTTDL